MAKFLLLIIFFALSIFSIFGFVIGRETNAPGVIGIILFPALLIAVIMGLSLFKTQVHTLKRGAPTSIERIIGLVLSILFLVPTVFFLYLLFFQ